MARYADAGHDVVALYLTRGEAGVAGKTHEQAAAIRTAEAGAACRVLKARPAFAGQLDGATEVNAARAEAFAKLVAAENPDVVFTQWPLDTHVDHRACASRSPTTRGCVRARTFALFFYEVDLGSDTQCFRPTHYVDVTATEDRKRAACMAHASQSPAGPRGFYDKDHEPMLRFRGMESGSRGRGVHPSRSEPATPVARMTGGLPEYRGFLIITQSTLSASLTRRCRHTA